MSTGRVEPLDLDSIRRRRDDILRLTERSGASNLLVDLLGSQVDVATVASLKDRIRPRVLAEAVPL
jgi:predicted nucleotidyltransferase